MSSPDKLEIGTVSRTFFVVPIWAAIEHGFFREQGLEVKLGIFGNASQVEPLVSGSMHIALASPEVILQNTAQGGPLRFIAGNARKLSHFLIAQPKFKRVEDLRGATIGILNMLEGTFFQLKDIMARHGLHYPEDYKVKDTGGVPPRHKALLEGSIDAGLQSIPWSYLEEDAGFSNLADASDYVPEWQFTTFNASRDWAAKNPDVVVRFLRAMLKSTAWMLQNRAGSAALVAREMDMALSHAERGWDYYTGRGVLAPDLALSSAGLTQVIAAQVKAGLLGAQAADNIQAYIEPAYLEEARRTST